MEERTCKCGHTISEVAEELSSEEDARTELSYASARASKHVAPPVENPIPIPIHSPYHLCSLYRVCLALEEIVKELRDAICDNVEALLREAEVERVRDLQEESSQSVVCSQSRLSSERWRRLNGIHQMHPWPGRREQRATRSGPYIRRAFSRCPSELWGPEEPGRQSPSPPSSSLGVVYSSLLWGGSSLPSNGFGPSRLVF